jgi:hypothetical protein
MYCHVTYSYVAFNILAYWKYSCDWPHLTKRPPPMSRHSGSALSFLSHLFLGLNTFLFTVLYVTFQLIRTEWRCPGTVECNVLSSLLAALFVVLKLWGSFVSSLTIQLFWTKIFLATENSHNLTFTYIFAAQMVDFHLQYQADMAKYVFWNGRTSGCVYKWKFILMCESLFCDWMLFDSLLKFWESQHFGNWAKLCVSLGGSCCCWQWMLTLPYFLRKFV